MTSAYEKIRLHSSLANLDKGWLVAWSLPKPDLALYNDHSGRVDLSDGGQSLRGISSIRITWTDLDVFQAKTVRDIAEFGTVYVTANRAWNGSGGFNDWIDLSGQGHIPNINPVGATSGMIANAITLVINNVTIENDPASF